MESKIKKTFVVADINLALAGLSINIKKINSNQIPTTQSVLSKLIEKSFGGEIENSIAIGDQIALELNIKKGLYRKCFMELTTLGLITKEKSKITLNVMVRTPFDIIEIKEPNK